MRIVVVFNGFVSSWLCQTKLAPFAPEFLLLLLILRLLILVRLISGSPKGVKEGDEEVEEVKPQP